MTLHDETTPFSIASTVARFTEWHMPASSAWMIRYFLPAAAPVGGSAARETGRGSNAKARATVTVATKDRMRKVPQGMRGQPIGCRGPSRHQDVAGRPAIQARSADLR